MGDTMIASYSALVAVCFIWSQVGAVEYVWVQNPINYESQSRQLDGHVIATYNNVYLVTQCSVRCLTNPDCESYNFLSDAHQCQINSDTHVNFQLTMTASSQYYLRNAITIGQNALGPCATAICENGGRCLTQSTSNSAVRTYLCLCAQGWTGTNCTDKAAEIDWSDWSAWGSCSTSCGYGVKLRSRQCINKNTGTVKDVRSCYGREQDEMYCNLNNCPAWSNWSSWGSCSTDNSCGEGVKSQTRTCTNNGQVGVDPLCMGPTSQTTPCFNILCNATVQLLQGPTYGEGRVAIFDAATGSATPICNDDNSWNMANAGVACKQLGFPSGARALNTYAPQQTVTGSVRNMVCTGTEVYLAHCPHSGWTNTDCSQGPHAGVQCIVDGGWSTWSAWNDCTVTCGDGTQSRLRHCNSPSAMRGGQPCSGDSSQSMVCINDPCPVNGEWQDWSTWTACTLMCGSGTKNRTRTCTEPANGGLVCSGATFDQQACNIDPCPVDGEWSQWSDWSTCSASCSPGGTYNRTRYCGGEANNGKPCNGPSFDNEPCNTNVPCPVDCQWQDWSPWATCTVSCGGGTQTHSRVRIPETFGGLPCTGSNQETQDCGTNPCPVDCKWNAWSSWSACSVSCGAGVETQTRTRIDALNGGQACVGSATNQTICNLGSCQIPGIWNTWADWSLCSATCGSTGTRTRARTCNMTSYGSLTVACLPTNGISELNTTACNRFSCTPIAASCSDLYARGLEDSNVYATIDPDSSGSNAAFSVLCAQTSTGVTTTVHNTMEAPQPVSGSPGMCATYALLSYIDKQSNPISSTQLLPMVDHSTSCSQYISWQCVQAPMNSLPNGTGQVRITYWRNRYNYDMGYWGGADVVPYKKSSNVACACAKNGSCGLPWLICSCDMNDNTQRYDQGSITNKVDLPVIGVCAGNGMTANPASEGSFDVGPLICTT